MADYAGIEDYLSVGAYKQGSNPRIDEAIEKRAAIENFLIQDINEKSSLAETLKMMEDISGVEIPEDEAKTYSKERELSGFSPGNADDGEDEDKDEENESEDKIPEALIEPVTQKTEEAGPLEEGAPDLPLMDF
jgi:hypothetical protein